MSWQRHPAVCWSGVGSMRGLARFEARTMPRPLSIELSSDGARKSPARVVSTLPGGTAALSFATQVLSAGRLSSVYLVPVKSWRGDGATALGVGERRSLLVGHVVGHCLHVVDMENPHPAFRQWLDFCLDLGGRLGAGHIRSLEDVRHCHPVLTLPLVGQPHCAVRVEGGCAAAHPPNQRSIEGQICDRQLHAQCESLTDDSRTP